MKFHNDNIFFRIDYIMFEAPVDFAAALEKELREDAMYTGRLRVFWEVRGMFDGDYALRFSLYSPALHELTGHWFSLALLEKRLKADFSVMEEIINNLHDRISEQHELKQDKQKEVRPDAHRC
jgi:hypothetical protein